MDINLSLTGTEMVAWWGAIIATSVLVWDIIKWKNTGAKLRLNVSSGMKTINMPGADDDDFIMVNLANIGDRPTTINQVALVYYKNFFKKIIRKPEKQFIVLVFAIKERPLPYILDIGKEWTELFLQDEEIEEMAQTGVLMCIVSDSVKSKNYTKRIVINKKT